MGKIDELHLAIASRLVEIAEMFIDDVYLTLVVRNPSRENANVISTNDPSLSKVLDVINGEGLDIQPMGSRPKVWR